MTDTEDRKIRKLRLTWLDHYFRGFVKESGITTIAGTAADLRSTGIPVPENAHHSAIFYKVNPEKSQVQ